MKKALSLLCVLAMVITAIAGCTTTPVPTTAPTTAPATAPQETAEEPTATPDPLLDLKFMIYDYGQTRVDNNDLVLQQVNEALKAAINTTCTFTYINQQNYPLTIASNDNFDLITTFDWMNYWEYAADGAFTEITDDMLEASKPAPFVLDPNFQDIGKYQGKRYMVPSMAVATYNWYWLVRGDLMEKYSVPDIKDLDSLGVYLNAVKAEPGVIPLDIPGGDAWVLPTMLVAESNWVAPGSPNCTSPFFVRKGDDAAKLFYAIDAPETLAFSKKMKEWQEAGYWSKTAMSSTVNNMASFKAGTSGAAWSMDLGTLYAMNNDPAYASWKVKAYPMYQYGFSGSLANTGISIYNKCQNPQRALNVINVLMSDKDLNNLAVYGIKDVNYTFEADGSRKGVDGDSGKAIGMWAVLNGKYKLPSKEEVVYADLVKHYTDNFVPAVATQFVLDNTNVKDYQSHLSDVWAQYGAVRCMGFESGTVEQAIADEKAQQLAGGMAEYMAEVQKQLDAYMATVTK